MKITKNKIIKWILRLIFFLTNFFILFLYPWINIFFKVMIYLCTLYITIYYINIISIELNINVKIIHKFRTKIKKSFYILSVAYIFIYIVEIYALSINLSIYESDFLKNCPYLLNDLNYNLHLKRRCELYNINKNSRYLYQYICSYDSSKEFKYKDFDKKEKKILSKEISPDYVICISAKKFLIDNNIIDLFNKEYKNTQKYFCSRTNKPKDYTYAKIEDCNNLIKQFFIMFLFTIIIFQAPYLLLNYYSLKNKYENLKLIEENVDEFNLNKVTTEMTNKSQKEINNNSNKKENFNESNKTFDDSNKTINKLSINQTDSLFNDNKDKKI